jgi:hypothetical protein
MVASSRRVALYALTILAVFQGVACPQAPAPSEWGDAVEGVQARLILSKSGPPALPGELPHLEVQFRNRGAGPVAFTYVEVVNGSEIEIDGRWYASVAAGNFATNFVVPVGGESGLYPVRFQSTLFESGTGSTFTLKPGRYFVRLRTQSGLVGKPDKVLTIVSNFVTVDVPDAGAAEERRALIEQTSAGGIAGLRAAERLLERFPESALDAIKAGATRDVNLRGNYIELAGTVPGEPALAFLRSQLAPEAGLFIQIRAAEALRARNQTAWEPALTDAWRNIRANLRTTRERPDNIGRLMNFLAGSGSVAAIEALANTQDASVDTRLAVVQTFMPRAKSRDEGEALDGPDFNLVMVVGGTLPKLPGGAADTAIERLLAVALDDKEQRAGYRRTFDDVTWRDPRVCDVAALVLSLRWPERYPFRWTPDEAGRDAQIVSIRNTYWKR